MKVVYIAGPFTANTPWGVECNVRRAEVIALAVAACGAMPLCPHTNTRFFHGQLTPDFWYEGTLELLRRCDAVISLPANESVGVSRELVEAKRLGIPVFMSAELFELKQWIEDNA